MCCIACHAIGDVFNGIPDGISGLGEDVSVLECHTKQFMFISHWNNNQNAVETVYLFILVDLAWHHLYY